MASGYLLDTTVISETRKLRADPGIMAFLAATNETGLFVSVLTLGELRKGIEANGKPIFLWLTVLQIGRIV